MRDYRLPDCRQPPDTSIFFSAPDFLRSICVRHDITPCFSTDMPPSAMMTVYCYGAHAHHGVDAAL